MALTLSSTVGNLVVERPSRARVFEKLGIDYCCGGKKPLGEVCTQRGLDTSRVLADLEASDAATRTEERDWTKAGLGELADHIVATHHAFLRQELPRLLAMTQKVAKAHGQRRPELVEVAAVFEPFAQDMFAHMTKEERVLFPAIRSLERQGVAGLPVPLEQPIAMMIDEHESAGRALARMRELTGGFAPPMDACGTYRAMLDGLAQVEADTHRHVHKENSILFPGAMKATESVARRG